MGWIRDLNFRDGFSDCCVKLGANGRSSVSVRYIGFGEKFLSFGWLNFCQRVLGLLGFSQYVWFLEVDNGCECGGGSDLEYVVDGLMV